jgi:hypothetical protein
MIDHWFLPRAKTLSPTPADKLPIHRQSEPATMTRRRAAVNRGHQQTQSPPLLALTTERRFVGRRFAGISPSIK